MAFADPDAPAGNGCGGCAGAALGAAVGLIIAFALCMPGGSSGHDHAGAVIGGFMYFLLAGPAAAAIGALVGRGIVLQILKRDRD